MVGRIHPEGESNTSASRGAWRDQLDKGVDRRLAAPR